MTYSLAISDDLIMEYLPLVKRIAGRISSRDYAYDEDDLVNIGVIGLMDALKKYDHRKKASFESYASYRIHGTIIDELRKTGKVSRNRMEKLKQYYSAKESLEKSLSRSPDQEEICQELGIDHREMSKIHETIHDLSERSLEGLLFSAKDKELRYLDLLEDDNSLKPEQVLIEKEERHALLEAVKKLDQREQLILSLYYVEELTLREIGEVLELSTARLSQLHGRIIMKLRDLIAPQLT